ncbi:MULTISPECIES: hypothetical protein [Pectobacterium]|uniref:hypothetical protein n=1 Tax=Pectobacterium TaxID=122277 RepID=UPI0024055D2D|nr:hypothetical protein [Pectobacterium brasiliense]MDG0806300.1 hypothetical protein [Pectobacterium brasiliense]MDY4347544.1 hypothetical protein [Pectobacterium brasiliense]
MTISPHINHVIELSLAEGNSVKEISEGWVGFYQVIFFYKKMSQELCVEIKKQEPMLRYFSTDKTPHNEADEGFICDESKIAVSYPKTNFYNRVTQQ